MNSVHQVIFRKYLFDTSLQHNKNNAPSVDQSSVKPYIKINTTDKQCKESSLNNRSIQVVCNAVNDRLSMIPAIAQCKWALDMTPLVPTQRQVVLSASENFAKQHNIDPSSYCKFRDEEMNGAINIQEKIFQQYRDEAPPALTQEDAKQGVAQQRARLQKKSLAVGLAIDHHLKEHKKFINDDIQICEQLIKSEYLSGHEVGKICSALVNIKGGS